MYRTTICLGACSLSDLWDYAAKTCLLCADFRGPTSGEGNRRQKADGQRVRVNHIPIRITLTAYL